MRRIQRPTASLLALWLAAVCAAGPGQPPSATDPPSEPPSSTPAPRPAPPPLLLADDSREPRVIVSWPTRSSGEIRLEGLRPYRSPGAERPLGRNLLTYLALGGTRVDMGLGHPDAATIRVGFYKQAPRRLFFDDLPDDALITITVEGIYMNQPVIPLPRSGLMHVQYMLSDLASCGLDANARNLYNTADAADTLLARVAPENARPGILSGGGNGHGIIETAVADDGAVTITWKFPYAILRHLQDPYQRATPGGFFEPQHFHLELELLAAASPDAPPPPDTPNPAP